MVSEETHWEKAAKTRMGKYLTQVETDFIFNSINPSNIHALMDLGSETGRFSSLKLETNARTISIDLDSYGLKRLKLKVKHVNAIQADARKIPVKNEVCDAIVMIEVLDYISDVEAALRECNRTLKLHASLVISFGNKSSLKASLRKMLGKSYRHSYGVVMRLLSQNGFTVKQKLGYSWLPLGRTSENRLIPFLIVIEKLFALRRIPSLSPWVLVCAEKTK